MSEVIEGKVVDFPAIPVPDPEPDTVAQPTVSRNALYGTRPSHPHASDDSINRTNQVI